MTKWNDFRSKHAGKGYTMEQLSQMYKTQKSRRSQRGGRPGSIGVHDPGHSYSKFKYYIIRSADTSEEIDMTEAYGGEEAGREDDRITLMKQNVKIVGVYDEYQYALEVAAGIREEGKVVAVHGTDSKALAESSYVKINGILSKTHEVNTGNGYNEHPQIA
jgi:hypothetical protein